MTGDGLELAVKLRSQAETNPLALVLWLRLVYCEDPDAEAEAIVAEIKPWFDAAVALVKAAQPAMRTLYDVAGPN